MDLALTVTLVVIVVMAVLFTLGYLIDRGASRLEP